MTAKIIPLPLPPNEGFKAEVRERLDFIDRCLDLIFRMLVEADEEEPK